MILEIFPPRPNPIGIERSGALGVCFVDDMMPWLTHSLDRGRRGKYMFNAYMYVCTYICYVTPGRFSLCLHPCTSIHPSIHTYIHTYIHTLHSSDFFFFASSQTQIRHMLLLLLSFFCFGRQTERDPFRNSFVWNEMLRVTAAQRRKGERKKKKRLAKRSELPWYHMLRPWVK